MEDFAGRRAVIAGIVDTKVLVVVLLRFAGIRLGYRQFPGRAGTRRTGRGKVSDECQLTLPSWVPAYSIVCKLQERGKLKLPGNCNVRVMPLDAAFEYPSEVPEALAQSPKYRDSEVQRVLPGLNPVPGLHRVGGGPASA